jgi:acetyl esterase
MLINQRTAVAIFALAVAFSFTAMAQENGLPPQIRTYKTIGTTELKAHVFLPADFARTKPHATIILLHGGGWNAGSPEWVYDDAKHFAGMGMVAIAGEYRLSDQKTITPLEAMSDVRDLIRWVRNNSADLHVNPHSVVVYGVSAGGHLAASAAVFPRSEESRISSVPDALMLLSPAVSLMGDYWPQILLAGRANEKDISPADNITHALPPIVIFEGASDTETPVRGVQRFCDEANRSGGACEIHLYPNVGHILTRNLDPHAQEMGPFDPDPADMTDVHAKEDAFLRKLGYAQ